MRENTMIGYVFKKLVGFIKGYFLFVGLLVTLCVLSLLFVSNKKKRLTVSPTDPIVLHLKLQGEVTESNDGHPLEQFLDSYVQTKQEINILALEQTLEQAAKDNRVKGLFVEVGYLKGGSALISEVRNAFKRFKTSGKKVVFWFMSLDTNAYYLASVADHLMMAPVGDLNLPGPVISMVYYADAIKKIGVDIELVKLGKYKLAVEPFVSNKMSREAKEMYTTLEGTIRSTLVADISQSFENKGKGVYTKEKIYGWLEQSLFNSEQAHDFGLVDQLIYLENAKKQLETSLNAKICAINEYKQGLNPSFSFFNEQDGIAIINAIGKIDLVEKPFTPEINPEKMRKQIQWAKENKHVKAVVLRVSSPGGSALASDVIWNDLKGLVEAKPLVVSMGSVAASGGYYISAPATKIFANPLTVTGSIGVFGLFPNIEKFQEKYGINAEVITQSKRKAMLNISEKMTPEDKLIVQQQVDFIYKTFLGVVSSGRKLPLDQVEDFAQGRVWTGSQAKALGIVDELGGFYEALKEAKKLAGFSSDQKVPILRWSADLLSVGEFLKAAYGMSINDNRVLNVFDSYIDKHNIQSIVDLLLQAKADPIQMLWVKPDSL